MIRLKRFCFCIVVFVCMLIGIIGTIIETFIYPIWYTIYYVITGKDVILRLSYSWKYFMKFINWYENKFGPNDDKRRI